MHAPLHQLVPPARRRTTLALLALLVSAQTAAAQAARFEVREAGRMLVGAADTDGDGAVSAEERAAFLAAHAPDPAAALEPDVVLALALAPFYDEDGDGDLGASDVAALRARWDADGDGAVDADERANGPRRSALRDGVVLTGLDANADGVVDAGEWAGADPFDLAGWLGAAAAVPEDINGFGPGTMVLTLRASLDADVDGTLQGDDVARFFADLDANGDGAVDAAELAPPQQRTTDWRVSDAMRAREPLMPWQRSLEDALALSRATGKPLLLCVNTEGEAASDNLAFGRYRDPAFVELARGFVPVLASPELHTERTYDTHGRRVVCPRFGRLICSEHVDVEPELFRRYFRGERVAPRHVGVAPDGTILFDLKLLQDLTVIDAALREHGVFDAELPAALGLDLEGLLASHDAAARERLAEAFAAGDVEQRLRLVARALSPSREAQHPHLVALGLYDASALVRSAAAWRLATDVPAEALDFAPRARWVGRDDPALRKSLVDGLRALVERTSVDAKRVRARRLARLYGALEREPWLDRARWRVGLAGAGAPGDGATEVRSDAQLDEALATLDGLLRADRDDADLNALVAEATLRKARRTMVAGGGNPAFFLQDAAGAARRALEVAPDHAHARATLARALYWLGDEPEAAADEAVRALDALGARADAGLTGELLDVVARARTASLYGALGNEPEWPAAWARQAVDATHVLASHPALTEEQALAGASLLENLEDYAGQAEYVRRVLLRFPASAVLHAWLRWQVLRDGDGDQAGGAALADAYDDLRAPVGHEATWRWFTAYARSIAGDTLALEGDAEAAAEAYERAIDTFEEAIELDPGFADSTAAYVEDARAKLAALERG